MDSDWAVCSPTQRESARADSGVHRSGIFNEVQDSREVDGARASEQRPQGAVHHERSEEKGANALQTRVEPFCARRARYNGVPRH
jgi:hypothetical protein